MYINIIWAAIHYSLRVFIIYRCALRMVNIETHSKHCCQSMTLAHLTSKNRNSTFVHPGDRFFDF